MRRISIFIILGFLFNPNFSFADGQVPLCSPKGFTVLTVNGVFTDERGAQDNKEALLQLLGRDFRGEDLRIDYLHNATHFAGFGDGLKAFKQKVEDGVSADDYDLIEMLKEASEKVTTRKLLLVAHSQGNFYANSFYDYVTETDEDTPPQSSPLKRGGGFRGGVTKESIGVYSVATPSDHVAGNGTHLTSKTDKVIAGLVGSLPFFRIMPPNTEIELKDGDDPLGHSFSEVYLKYKGAEIVGGIEGALDKLKSAELNRNEANTELPPPRLADLPVPSTARQAGSAPLLNPYPSETRYSPLEKGEREGTGREGGPCIEAPKLTVAHKVTGAVLAVADPVAEVGKDTAVFTVGVAYQGGVFVVKVGVKTAGAIAALGNFVAETSVAATVWTYKTGVAAAKATGSAIADVTGAAYSAVKSLVSGNNDSNNLELSNVAAVGNAMGQMGEKGGKGEMGQTGERGQAGEKGEKGETAANPSATLADRSDGDTLQSLAKTLALAEAQVAEMKKAVAVIDNQSQKTAAAEAAKPDPSAESGKNEKSDSDDGPKIIFIGAVSGFGGGEKPKVLASTVNPEILTPVVETASLSTPTLSASQCDYSLATDGCLLATTTVNFSWTEVSGADYYEINKNGTVATTTNTTFDAVAADFSDYVFKVSAINTATTSPTSSKTVSIATIPIAINEIAWMGTVASTNDEWLELKNNTAHTIDLSQWEIQATDGTPRILLSGSIQPNQYLVFERTDNNTITDVLAYQIYTGALGNNGEELVLSHASITLDRTPAVSGDGWPDGSNADKATMERFASKESGADPKNWGTWGKPFEHIKNGLDADGNEVNGTPGARNGLSYLINKGEDILEDMTLSADEELYIITDSISVSASSTLSIEPGVVILFDSDSELEILGQIRAEGTAGSQIVFESLDSGEQDGEIIFDGGTGTSTLQYVRLESTEGVAVTDGARLEVDDSEFVGNEKGFEIDNGSAVVIENSAFASTTGSAIAVYDSNVTIASSTITDTLEASAIEVYDGTNLTISSTTIDRTHEGDGIGAYNSAVTITNSIVSTVLDGDGIGSYDSTITIASSTIEDIRDGDGVGFYDSNAVITGSAVSNIADGNGVGGYDSIVSIASSTIENISGGGDAVGLYDSNSTIKNTTVQNGEGNGIVIDEGTATISGGSVSDFPDGAGISVDEPDEPVVISGTEVSDNAAGIISDAAESVTISPDVSAHDNDTNIVVE